MMEQKRDEVLAFIQELTRLWLGIGEALSRQA